MKRNKNDHIIATFVCLGTINDKKIWIILTINIIFDVFIEHIIILFSHLQWEIYCKKDLITPLRRFYFNSHTLNVLNYTYIFCSISRKEGFLRQQASCFVWKSFDDIQEVKFSISIQTYCFNNKNFDFRWELIFRYQHCNDLKLYFNQMSFIC